MAHDYIEDTTKALDQYFRDINAYELISVAEERKLSERKNHGDEEARNDLVTAHLRFAVNIAKNYQNRGLSFMELISHANLGLIEGVDRFDEKRGFRLISYAVWWIRQSILYGLGSETRTVRLPMNRVGNLRKIEKAYSKLTSKLGRNPSYEELAKGLESNNGLVGLLSEMQSTTLSLDSIRFDSEDQTFLEGLIDDTQDVEGDLESEERRDVLVGALDGLEEREDLILRRYFGLDGEESYTLEKIGVMLGLTRERVRQIKERALKKLRHPKKNARLRSYF